uniref:fibronectin type III domain-containing protein n=1 Tax=Fulvivirga sp. TaxID=1931237 RepID=UPI0040493AF0
MKKTGLIFLLAFVIPFLGWSQTEHRAVVNSQGGGNSTGGTVSHFGVAGQQMQVGTVGEFGQDQNPETIVTMSIGFLYSANDKIEVLPCVPPSGIAVSQVAESSATVTWNAQQGNVYSYRYKKLSETEFVEVTNQTIPNVQLTGLSSGTSYIFQVKSFCSGERESEWSAELRFDTFGAPPCVAPAVVNATVSQQSVRVTWSLPSTTPSDYVVRYKLLTDTEWNTTSLNSVTLGQYDISGLVGGAYQVQVGTVCSGIAEPAFATTVLFQIENPCLVPELSFVEATSNSVSVSWGAVDGAGSYNLRIKQKGSFDWFGERNTENQSSLFEGLIPGTEYEVVIQSQCSETVASSYSNPLTVTTQGVVCQVPQNLDVNVTASTSATIAWLPTNALYYELRYKRVGGANFFTVQSTTTQVNLTSLVGGTTYEVEVKSVCTEGTAGSAFSNKATFTTLPSTIVCNTPASVAHTFGETNGTINIAWQLNASAKAYEVRYKRSNILIWNTLTTLASEVNLENLIPGASYDYQVRAFCSDDRLSASSWSPLTTIQIPNTFDCVAPSQLTVATGQNAGEISVSWNEVPGVLGYKVFYRKRGFPYWSSVVNPESTISGLEPGAEFEVAVASICSQDQSFISALGSSKFVRSAGEIACVVPTNISVSLAIGSVSISWNNVSPQYLFAYRVKGANTWITTQLATNSFSSTSLQAGVVYQFMVRALCSTNSTSDFSFPGEFTVPGAPTCGATSMSTTFNATTNSLSVSWTQSTSALYYILEYRRNGTTSWTTLTETGTSRTVSGLQSGTNYDFRVQSVCDAQGTVKSNPSAIVTFATSGIPTCTTPTNISATASTTSVQIAFTGFENVTRYEVRYKKASDYGWQLAATTGNTANLVIEGLSQRTTYNYEVRTICDASGLSVSQFSVIQSFETLGDVCAIPLASVEAGTTNVTFAMPQGSDAPAGGYYYEYRLQGTLDFLSGTSLNGALTFGNLLAGMTYQLRVAAICDVASNYKSPFSALIFITAPGVSNCTVPESLTVTQITDVAATLSWVGTASSFDIQYRKSSPANQSWENISNVMEETTFSLENLTPNTDYQWRVRSDCDGGGSSSFSGVGTFKTLGNSTGRFTSENSTTLDLVTELESLEFTLDVYPNPFIDQFNVTITNPVDSDVKVGLYNMAGVKLIDIFEGTLVKDTPIELNIDGAALPHGMYLIMVGLGNGERVVKKVIR